MMQQQCVQVHAVHAHYSSKLASTGCVLFYTGLICIRTLITVLCFSLYLLSVYPNWSVQAASGRTFTFLFEWEDAWGQLCDVVVWQHVTLHCSAALPLTTCLPPLPYQWYNEILIHIRVYWNWSVIGKFANQSTLVYLYPNGYSNISKSSMHKSMQSTHITSKFKCVQSLVSPLSLVPLLSPPPSEPQSRRYLPPWRADCAATHCPSPLPPPLPHSTPTQPELECSVCLSVH